MEGRSSVARGTLEPSHLIDAGALAGVTVSFGCGSEFDDDRLARLGPRLAIARARRDGILVDVKHRPLLNFALPAAALQLLDHPRRCRRHGGLPLLRDDTRAFADGRHF